MLTASPKLIPRVAFAVWDCSGLRGSFLDPYPQTPEALRCSAEMCKVPGFCEDASQQPPGQWHLRPRRPRGPALGSLRFMRILEMIVLKNINTGNSKNSESVILDKRHGEECCAWAGHSTLPDSIGPAKKPRAHAVPVSVPVKCLGVVKFTCFLRFHFLIAL